MSHYSLPTCFFAVLLVVTSAFGQSEQVALGPVQIQVGMSRDEVLSSLRDHFRLSEAGENAWIVL
jgi:hypothetical protein